MTTSKFTCRFENFINLVFERKTRSNVPDLMRDSLSYFSASYRT